jgi:hypothetical protein
VINAASLPCQSVMAAIDNTVMLSTCFFNNSTKHTNKVMVRIQLHKMKIFKQNTNETTSILHTSYLYNTIAYKNMFHLKRKNTSDLKCV